MIDDKIVPDFWLSEFLASDTAIRLGLDNTPLPTELANVRNILAPGMQRVRDVLRGPVSIRSGYRSPEVNRAVRGAASSQHLQGLAADFICPSVGMPSTLAKVLQQHFTELRFDQLIQEGGWVHISFVPSKPRGEVLTAHFTAGGVSYSPGLA